MIDKHDNSNDIAPDVQNFEYIINNNLIYVDKTKYLANLISDHNKTWFFTRPRRFGKTLTLSTLEAVFSAEKRELFQGLDIESRLSEDKFAPRPVIRLDMSGLTDDDTLEELKLTLGEMIVDIAEKQDITLDPARPPKSLLAKLIKRSVKNSKRKVAILIDEYDSPFIAFMNRSSKEREKLLESLRSFYKTFKTLDDHISFIFVTGITKSYQFGPISAFNTYSDISIEPQYGAMCGFTQEELINNFSHHLERTAKTLEITEERLLAKMADYYNGFCFDAVTRVYNPFSTLLFFNSQAHIFQNYWFDTGTPTLLANFLKNQRLTVGEFSGLVVSDKFAKSPGEYEESNHKGFLYQSGYLTLRPGPSKNTFRLDYPNREVLESMSSLLVMNFFGVSGKDKLCDDLSADLEKGDAPSLIDNFKIVIAKITYDDFTAAKTHTNAKANTSGFNFGEWLYRSNMLTALHAAGVDVYPESHGSYGRTDIVVKSEKWAWIMEIKVCENEDKEIETLKNARDQLIEKRYAAGYKNTICLGIVINDQKRTITRWENFGDLAKEYEAIQNRSPEKAP